jgi:hypothetical protein
MTTAGKAKAAGFRTLQELVDFCGVDRKKLGRMDQKTPEMFNACLKSWATDRLTSIIG